MKKLFISIRQLIEMRVVRIVVCSVLLILLSGVWDVEAQNFRASYTFWRQNNPDRKHSVYRDMMLDCCGGSTVFYPLNGFLSDSLKSIAFDLSGQIVDEEAYGTMTRIKGNKTMDVTKVDFRNSAFVQRYSVGTMLIEGSGQLLLPEWQLLEDTKECCGYLCHCARADYLGRVWTVWYTEEIPVSAGPWLLWGAPGLIVDARDETGRLVFRLASLEPLAGGGRGELIDKLFERDCKRASQTFISDMRRAESVNNKLHMDSDFFGQMLGKVYIKRGGTPVPAERPPFIPLIPIEYWTQ